MSRSLLTKARQVCPASARCLVIGEADGTQSVSAAQSRLDSFLWPDHFGSPSSMSIARMP